MRSMRVIHAIAGIAEESSGPSYSVVRLCEALKDYGHEPTLAALDWRPIPSSPAFLRTFPLGTGPCWLGRSGALYRWLVDQACRHSVDVIHTHGLWMMPNVYPGWVARRYEIPLVVSPRGMLSEWAFRWGSWLKPMFWGLVQRPALAATICFHATAESEYEDIRCMDFQQPVAIIPNGVDVPPLKELLPSEPRTLLFLSRIHPKKAVDILLKAWQAVSPHCPEWRLRIVGPDDGGYLRRMQVLAAELRLKRVEFCGPLYGETKFKAYQEAELFVLPTHSENFGMAVAEALAAGTPAVVSKGAPWSGVETHGAGWWIDIGVDPLIACLEKALRCSSAELAAMGWRGRMWMEKEFSWFRIGQMMGQTYRWILQGGTAPTWVRLD